jgi:hypothetical protein
MLPRQSQASDSYSRRSSGYGQATAATHANVSINSLGPIDHLQIAFTGLEPGKKYWVMLVGSADPRELATFSAGIGGTAIAQALGPLKRVMAPSQVSKR